MITDRYAEERIRRWLIATAPRHLPDRVLTDTYERTRRMAQASSARTWWSRVTRPLPIVFAAGAMAIVLVAVSVGLGTSELGAPAQPVIATIGGQWITDTSTAVTIERDPTDDGRYYWRAAAYDQIGLDDLSSSTAEHGRREPPARPCSRAWPMTVDGDGLKQVSFTVRPEAFTAPTVLSPATPLFVDRDVRLTTVGRGRLLRAARARRQRRRTRSRPSSTDPDSPDAPTESGLRARRNRLPGRGRRPCTRPKCQACSARTCVRSATRSSGQPTRRRRTTSRNGWSRCSSSDHLSLRHRRPRRRLRHDVDARMLRHVQARLLPALRDDDGGRPAQPRYPGTSRLRVPARRTQPRAHRSR